jgi:2-amino-4-hydroxy-6-hydroxymethyldihydropteridine diphosphokinase
MQHTVYISLGTNLGDRVANLWAAREALPPAVRVRVASPVYETAPWGYTEQPANRAHCWHTSKISNAG